MHSIRTIIKSLIPKPIFKALQPYYHFLLAGIGCVLYRHPSSHITVIAVTGTKGKSSVTEILGHILKTAGKKTATLSTIQFTYGDTIERNLFKMTMPGRFFVQKFLRRAVDEGCTHAIVEMTSEGAKQFRHRFVALDALIFTNLSPEHIESHGSFEQYKNAKLRLAKAVERSNKRPRIIVANTDDAHGTAFLNFAVEQKLGYSLNDLKLYTLHKDSTSLVVGGATIRTPLIGKFNVYNALAAMTMAKALGIDTKVIQEALESLPTIKGRVEQFKSPAGSTKQITAVVDYAHTPDSLEQLYQAFPDKEKVCVLGNTGGGRDTWKRPEMAAIAAKYCSHIVLTNEDPYDEDPMKIITDMEVGVEDKTKLTIEMDRKRAIEKAITLAPDGGVVLISGKGTDPYIMGPNGTKTEWSDAAVTQEALARVLTQSN